MILFKERNKSQFDQIFNNIDRRKLDRYNAKKTLLEQAGDIFFFSKTETLF